MRTKTMQLENITYEDSKFNLLPNRYQDTNAIAIMIQEVGEDYCEPITVDCVLDPEIKEEDEIEGDLVAILADETELVDTLFEYGLIKAAEWVQVDFFEGVYFYEPTQELLDYMKELDEKYNN